MARRLILSAALSCALAVFLLVSRDPLALQERDLRDVFVTNWPATQKVEGTVEVQGAIRSARTQRFEGVIVSPVEPAETTRLVEAGTLVTDGFRYVVLSLAGQVKGEIAKAGAVGAILLPEEQRIQDAFEERGEIPVPAAGRGGRLPLHLLLRLAAAPPPSRLSPLQGAL